MYDVFCDFFDFCDMPVVAKYVQKYLNNWKGKFFNYKNVSNMHMF